MLYEIRNTNTTISNIIAGDKFKNNALLMDFQMLPTELKNELEIKFNNIIV